jgi:hypothetical protein
MQWQGRGAGRRVSAEGNARNAGSRSPRAKEAFDFTPIAMTLMGCINSTTNTVLTTLLIRQEMLICDVDDDWISEKSL